MSYTAWDDSTTFFSRHKANGSFLGIFTGITFTNFTKIGIVSVGIVSSNTYNYDITISNHIFELMGYFLAPLSGPYTFILKAYSGTSFQYGAGSSFCNDPNSSVSGNLRLFTQSAQEGCGSTEANIESALFNLVENKYSSVKMIIFNWSSNYGLDLLYYFTNRIWVKFTVPLSTCCISQTQSVLQRYANLGLLGYVYHAIYWCFNQHRGCPTSHSHSHCHIWM